MFQMSVWNVGFKPALVFFTYKKAHSIEWAFLIINWL